AMMNRWVDRGVDGFRMDVVNLISKDQSFGDGPVRVDGLGDGSAYYVSGPRVHEFLAQMHQEVFTGRDGVFLTVGEMPGVTVEQARVFTDPARREVDMVFDFEHMGLDRGPGGKFDVRPLRLTDLKATLGRWQAGLADAGWTSLYWDNHDQPRICSRWGDGTPASAKALATVLHLHRGTPYVYQGEEIGMTNADIAALDGYRDIESLRWASHVLADGADEPQVLASLAAASRDNARTPMQWDASDHAGFTTGTPWMPVNPNHTTINVAAQRDDPQSVLAHYRRLIALRREDVTVSLGRFDMLLPDDEHIYAFTRTWADDRLLVAANLTAQPRQADLGEDLTSATLVLATHAETIVDGPVLRLRPWQAVVVRTQ
ncbi:MAG: alpha-amylase family glycosyl hydrolase, partial [Micrococcales bacterium]|nr:alpha-amylase family glycosyl hydrolase [Micrococcales bacterium]